MRMKTQQAGRKAETELRHQRQSPHVMYRSYQVVTV